MPTIISQSLTIPANVTLGGVVQAGDVSTLYNTFNAFSLPDSVVSLLSALYSTDSAQVLNGPATSTSTGVAFLDNAISSAPAKTVIHFGSYSWQSTGVTGGFTLSFRKNGSAYATTPAIATSTAGSGMYFMVTGPHDATIVRPVIGFNMASTGTTVQTYTANADLTNVNWTSIGVSLGVATSTATVFSLGHQRVWQGP